MLACGWGGGPCPCITVSLGPMVEEVNWERDSQGGESWRDSPELDRPRVELKPCAEAKNQPRDRDAHGDQEGSRKSENPSSSKDGTAFANNNFVPARIQEALDAAKDFKDFKEKRIFKYLHLFSGPQDNLAVAIKEECEAGDFRVEVESVDIRIDKDHDLKDTKKWMSWEEKVAGGEYDGSHAGFPCGSFSMLRWRPSPGMPKPVRSSEYPYGLPTNDERQQREADQGTLFATWSVKLLKEQSRSMRRRGVPEVCTAENPPGSAERTECPAWDLPEVRKGLEEVEANFVEFHTCAYMQSEKKRFYKPAKWGGRLEGIRSLSKVCRCPSWVNHIQVVGKEASTKAGVYPPDLCKAIAKLIVASWKRTLNLEFWRHRCSRASQEVSSLQQKWLANEEKRLARVQSEKAALSIKPESFGASFSAEDLEHKGAPKATVGDSKKDLKRKEDEFYLGGMRNPRKAVERLWKLQDAGEEVRRVWEDMVVMFPDYLKLGREYGSDRAQYDEELLQRWKRVFGDLLKVERGEGVTLHDNWMFRSPLDGELWDAWCKFAGDPEHCLGEWAANGVPLGMAEQIPLSKGVFPPTRDKDASDDQTPEIEAQVNVENYRSFYDQPEDAELEVERLVAAGFALIVSKEEACRRFGVGTVSRLALIVKDKPDGSRKRRVIVDMRRSGGNDRATCPERIILPRIVDVTYMAKNMYSRAERMIVQGKRKRSNSEVKAELVSFDLQDAFCHFGLCQSELRNALAPRDDNSFMLFRAMLFGFKTAPLIMGRLSAAVGRLMAALIKPDQGQSQVYVDDLLMLIRGTEDERHSMVSLLLYTLRALGVQVSLRKGERGEQLKWIGVTINLEWTSDPQCKKRIVYAIPKTMILEIKETLESWQGRGMIGIRELRTLTGKLSWVAGIVIRMRWAVSVLYSVIASMEEDIRNDTETLRARRREDDRRKPHLVTVKRLEVARRWLIEVMKDPDRMLLKTELLEEKPLEWAIVCDACPTGYGAVLTKVSHRARTLQPVEAYEAMFTKTEAKMLALEWGESSSQGPLEAIGLWRAIKTWATKIQGTGLLIRSDSAVTLVMAEKGSSSSVSMNFMGGELTILAEKLDLPPLKTQHLAGKLNEEADWLSRGKDHSRRVPDAIRGLKIRTLGPITRKDFAIEPPGDGGRLWHECPHSDSVFRCL